MYYATAALDLSCYVPRILENNEWSIWLKRIELASWVILGITSLTYIIPLWSRLSKNIRFPLWMVCKICFCWSMKTDSQQILDWQERRQRNLENVSEMEVCCIPLCIYWSNWIVIDQQSSSRKRSSPSKRRRASQASSNNAPESGMSPNRTWTYNL
jgi:hypothetical protein